MQYDLNSSKNADKDPEKGSSTADSSSQFGQQCLFVDAEIGVGHINCSFKDEV